MYPSNKTRLSSLLQLQIATLIFFLDGVAAGQSRLSRMPSFYGKRSSSQPAASKTRPDFGIDNLEALLASVKSSIGDGENSEFQKDLKTSSAGNDVFATPSGQDELDSLKRYINLVNGNFGLAPPSGLKGINTAFKNGANEVGGDEKEMVRRKLRQLSEYNTLLTSLIDSILSLQSDLIGVLDETDVAADWPTTSSDTDAQLVPFKRGTLSRLPQFYGRRK